MDLHRTSANQAGVFSRSQALASGLSASAVSCRLAAGEWRRVLPSLPGVYVHAATSPTWESRLWAAVLAVGAPCAVAVGTAAAVWAWTTRGNGSVDVVVPPRRYPRVGSMVRVRRLHVAGSGISTHHGLPVTTRARTLADCLRFLPEGRAVDILDRAQQIHGMSLRAVLAQLPERGPGVGQAHRLLAAAGPERSTAERIATALLKRAGVTGWTVNHRVRLQGQTVEIDGVGPSRQR